VVGVRLPQFGDRASFQRMHRAGRDLRQRLEHEGVAQFVARDAQVANAFGDEVVIQHDVDIERAVAVARAAAVAAVRVLECMQPGDSSVRIAAAALMKSGPS
jgi:hypothetical protein